MAIESTITNSILKYLNDKVDKCTAEKVFGGMIGKKGKADINGCWKGRSFRIEVKSPDHGNKTSLAQEINLKLWESAGALCMVVTSLKEVKEMINNG